MVFRASVALASTALFAACGSPMANSGGPVSPPTKAVVQRVSFISPSELLPDLDDSAAPLGIDADGTKRFLTMRMRITESPGGAIRKAPGLLPAGRTSLRSIELPSRLGGGFLFVGATSSRTQVWRAKDWLAPLEPLVQLNKSYDDVVVGFDRIYLASQRSNTNTLAIDPSSGAFRPLGKLPQPAGQGPMAFADAWRGVAVADFRGPLATFDAGETWIPLGIQKPILGLEVEGDDIVIKTQNKTYALDGHGQLSTHAPSSPPADTVPSRGLSGPLGRRPLRAAIERGYPIAPARALVAHGGHLLEVSTEDGAILRTVRNVYPKSFSECQGIPLGKGAGFVCGVRHGATVVYAYEPPRTLRTVLTYPEPKVVVSSGNGAIVVRAPCPGGTPASEQSQYCVRDVSGNQREIRFQGDLGAERVVALADGRIAIIIAPRPGAEARLVVLDGDKAVTKAISFANLSRRQRSLVRRGLWMQGGFEVKPGVVGMWVEAGGPVLGLHIDLDGKAEAGALQTTPGVILLSGRFGLVWRHGGEGLETTDGGLTWKEFELPSGRPGRATTTRGCSPIGCAVEGWLRVGWGEPKERDALDDAPESKNTYPPFRRSEALRFVCAPSGRATPPPAPLPIPKAVPRPPKYTRYRPPPRPTPATHGWIPFGPSPAPALRADEVGVSGGRDYGDLQFRAYAWGPKAADWSRSGHWIVRFDDPYDPVGLPVSTAPAIPPWNDLTIAAINVNSVRSAVADPGGRAAVLGWCPAPNQCQVFGLTDGQSPTEFQFKVAQYLPLIASAVRTPEGWFLLTSAGNLSSSVYAVDGTGRVRELATYPRVRQHQYDRVRLVRRANGTGVALWVTSTTGEGETDWYALPIDTVTGDLTGVQSMGPADLDGKVPEPCSPGQDGWLIDTQLPVSPNLRLPEGGSFGGSERVRLRVDGERTCIEGITARARESEIRFGRHQAWLAGNRTRTIPLTVWDSGSKRKYELMCAANDRAELPER